MSSPVYKAVVFVESSDERGNVSLRRVTTAQWVTVPQIAASVGVAKQTMYRMIVDDNAMPHYRLGRQIRVRAEDFATWLEACRDAEYERPCAK